MLKQTVTWTALPNGTDGPPGPGATLRVSAFVAPRLWNDDGTPKMKLSQFPDFLDWPSVVGSATFKVELDGGTVVDATVTSASPEPDLWGALFKTDTDVVPFRFEDLSGAEILTFSAVEVHDTIVDTYQNAATNPVFHGGNRLPATEDLEKDPGLDEISRPVRPEPPWVPADKPTEIPVRPPELRPTKPTAPGCLGCLPAILLAPPLAIWAFVRKLLKPLGLPVAMSPLPFTGLGGGGGSSLSPGDGGAGGGGVSAKKQAFDDLRTFVAPTSQTPEPLPTTADYAQTFDFHKMVASLGDYPKLLRRMGLVVDLSVTIPPGLSATGTLRIVPTVALALPSTNHTPRTHYDLGGGRFVARPRVAGADIANGLLRLQDGLRFRVHQVDVAGSGVKLQNAATSIVGVKKLEEVPVNRPDEQGLPALQTAGIAVVRPDVRSRLAELFRRMYALNHKLAQLDGSPIQPLGSGEPSPAPADDVFAEDLVRGYRIDIRDADATGWLSLCQRVGTYAFLDAGPGGTLAIEDEGFVQMGVTEALQPSATRVLRAHETLFTWDGWSLAAPRPGDAILPDTDPPDADHPDGVTKHGVVPNTAVTPFRLETTFKAKKGTLPRLRYGHTYRLRARVVDLAGNSVFEPDDLAFDVDQPEVSGEFVFRRFEPVGPPPVMLREVPKEGESLERLTVRSARFDADASIRAQSTERHLAPPKGAQLLAERHGHFDAGTVMASNSAAYDLASREAGSLTHRLDLATNALTPIDGVKKVEDAALHRTYWLQELATFDVSYLPDPFARGVLLRGLPGMVGIDDVQDNLNRLPFDGAWPHLEPLRLRMTGLPKGEASGPPTWDSANRVLTVGLAQGETATVLIASYFHQADLETMGVWDWTLQKAPPNLADLKTAAVEGRNWLHLPYRTLTLVHAVQQPLEVPVISAFDTPIRGIGDTAATINGTLAIDAKSTGKVDIWSEWSDPLDDPSDPTNDPTTARTTHRMHVRDVPIPDTTNDSPSLKQILDGMRKGTPPKPGAPPPPPPAPSDGLRHALGDTKYHKVAYALVGTTRFREHFPPAIANDPKKLVRPLAEALDPDGSPTKELDIPNSARPVAPRVVSILPTFHWSESEALNVRTRERRGGGLRVYLERPWFQSGEGEQLGVVIKSPTAPLGGKEAERLQKYTSEWAMDPLWKAAETGPLRIADFATGKASPLPRQLAEIPSTFVGVVGFDPEYNPTRRLWFADIAMNVDTSYFPFVRLALSRYQPKSIDGAHLSSIVLSDFVQVAPHRRVDYDLRNVSPNGSLGVVLRGPGHALTDRIATGGTVVVARLERREHGDSMSDELLGWTPIDMIVMDRASEANHDVTWTGEFRLGSSLPTPLRVSVLEAQALRSDGNELEDLVRGRPQEREGVAIARAAMMDLAHEVNVGYRIVFADATVV
jgi:hypothetical protein